MISLFRRLPCGEHDEAARAREVAWRLTQVMADDRTVAGLRAKIGERREIDQPVRVDRRRRA